MTTEITEPSQVPEGMIELPLRGSVPAPISAANPASHPDHIVLRNATMKPTQGVPETWDRKDPLIAAKIAVMPNDTHPDLIGAIRNILVSANLTPEQLAIYDNHFLIKSGMGTSLMAQKVAVCSFWNVQMCNLGNETFAARQTLAMMNASSVIGDILDLFGHQPLDAIIKHKLPA